MKILDLLFHFAELLAAIFGTVYVVRYREDTPTRYFVIFLWITVFVEVIGGISGYIGRWESFSFLEDTFLEKNAWLYNLYSIISYCVYFLFFKYNIRGRNNYRIINIIIVTFIVSSIGYLIFSKEFFEVQSSFIMIIGTLLLMTVIFIYFFQLLQSDRILDIGSSIVFYVAAGALVMHLCITPLLIFIQFFSIEKSPEFVEVFTIIIPCTIIFTYTCYSIGFLVCISHKKLYRKNKSYS